MGAEVEGGEDGDLVVVEAFGVEGGSGSSGAAAEEDEGSATANIVDALFPDFDLAGAFDDNVVARALGFEVVDVDGFGSELLADGEAGWVSPGEGDVVNTDLFESGNEEETDCSGADDEDSQPFMKALGGAETELHFSDGLGDTGVGFQERCDVEWDVVWLGVDVLFYDPFWDEQVFGERAENLGGHDRLTKVFLASAAPEAVSAGGGVDAHHGVANVEFGAFAGGDDCSRVFVTEDSGHGNLGMSASVGLEVGSAGGGGFDSDEDVARIDGWDCDRSQGQYAGGF